MECEQCNDDLALTSHKRTTLGTTGARRLEESGSLDVSDLVAPAPHLYLGSPFHCSGLPTFTRYEQQNQASSLLDQCDLKPPLPKLNLCPGNMDPGSGVLL